MFGISDRARAYVRSRATLNMKYECRIERVLKAKFDQNTGRASSPGRSVIYDGPCRVWEVAGQAGVQVLENEIIMQTTNISIPWDVEPIPRRDDEIVITGANLDSDMVGRRFVIMETTTSGDLRATRRFIVMGNLERL